MGVTGDPNALASELSLRLGASSRVITRRASRAVSSTSKRGRGRPLLLGEVAQEPTSNGALWATSTVPVANSRNAGSADSIGGASATIGGW